MPPDVCALWRCEASEMLGNYVDYEGCCAGRRRLGVQVPPVGPYSPMFMLCVLWLWECLSSLLVLEPVDNASWVVWVYLFVCGLWGYLVSCVSLARVGGCLPSPLSPGVLVHPGVSHIPVFLEAAKVCKRLGRAWEACQGAARYH